MLGGLVDLATAGAAGVAFDALCAALAASEGLTVSRPAFAWLGACMAAAFYLALAA